MNVEKLKRLQQQVRIGGKGTPRRKKKIMHQTAATDDKKLQSSLKKLSVSTIPGIEEVNIIKDDLTVIHFNNPKAQASLSANTFAVTGHGEVKKIVEMLPELLPQLGQETVVQLRMFANSISNNQKQTGEQPNAIDGAADDDDDVPMLVVDFDQVAKIEATKQNESGAIADESQKSLNKNEKDTKEPIIASVENTPNNAKKAPPAAGSGNGEQKKQNQKPQTKPNETQKKQVKEKGVGNNQKNEKAKEAMKRNEKPKDKLAVAENKVGDQVTTKSVKQVSAANEQPADKSVDNVKVSLVGTEGVAVPKELTPEKVEVKENKQENVKSKVNKKGNVESKENKQDQPQQQTDKPVVIDKGKKQQQKVKQDKQNARQPINKQTDKAGGNNANGQAKSVESKTKSTNQDDEKKQLKAEEKKVEQKLIVEAVQLTKTDSSEANAVEPSLKSSIEIKEKQLNVEQKPQPTTVEIDNSAPKKDKTPVANAGQSALKPEQIEPTSDGKPVTPKTDVKATGETKAAKEVKVVGEQQAKANVQEPLAVEDNAIKTAKQENENVNKPKTTEQLLVAEKVSLQKTAPKQSPVKKSPPPQGGKVQPQPKSNIQQEQGNVQEPQPSGQASKAKTQTGPIQQTGVKQQSPSKSPPKQQQQQQAPNKKDTEAKKQEGTSKQKSGAIKSQAQQLQQPVSNNGNKGQKPAVSPNKPITPATPTTTPTTTPATPASTTPKPATPASSTPKPTTPIATSPKGGTPTPVQAKKANTPPQKSEDAVKGPKSAALKAQNQQTTRGNANAVQQTQQATKAQKVQKNTEVAANTLAPLKTAAASTKTADSPQSPSLAEPLAVSPVKVDQGQVGAVLTSVKEPPTPVTAALPASIANESAQIAVSTALASPSAPAPAPPSPVAATPIPTTAPASNAASTPTTSSALPTVLPSPIGAPPSPPTSAATPSPLLLPTPAEPTLAQVAAIGTAAALADTPPSPNVIAPALNTTTPDPNSSTKTAAQISIASASVIAPLGTPSVLGEVTPLPVVDAPAPVENPPKTVLTATPDPIITPSVPDPNLITNAASTTTAVPVSPTKAGTPVGPN